MTSKDRQGLSNTRRLASAGIAGILLLGTLLAVLLLTRVDDAERTVADPTPSSFGTTTTTTRLDTRTEVVGSLRRILKIRDRAFRDRNPEILKQIYTVDCPCLEGDKNAIEELITKKYQIVGGATSVHVRRVEQVNKGLWLVIADFRSAPLRIEAQDGILIREEAQGSDLFQFAMSKDAGSEEWLLGRATAYREGSG